MARLTKKELDVLKNISEKQGIIGKKHLDKFIWINTTEPKYEKGDKVVFTDYVRKIYGTPMVKWVGTITERTWNTLDERFISYKLTVKYEVDGTIKETTAHIRESHVLKKDNSLADINIVTKRDKYEDSITV